MLIASTYCFVRMDVQWCAEATSTFFFSENNRYVIKSKLMERVLESL